MDFETLKTSSSNFDKLTKALETNLKPEDQSNKRKYDDDRFWKPDPEVETYLKNVAAAAHRSRLSDTKTNKKSDNSLLVPEAQTPKKDVFADAETSDKENTRLGKLYGINEGDDRAGWETLMKKFPTDESALGWNVIQLCCEE